MPTKKEVAVIVLNWNGRKLLEEFVPQWIATTPNWAELIIVDNGSMDDSVSFLKATYPEIYCLELGYNYGFAEGYNKAIEELEYDIVVLLNSDATPVDSSWLDKPCAWLRDNQDVVAVQPKICSYREPQRFEYAGAAGGFLDLLGYPYCRGRVLSRVEEDKGQYDTPCDIMWASGACLIIRRSNYLAAGGLDATFFAHQEEIDLCWRIRARGGRILCEPSSKVLHIGGGSLDMKNPRKVYLNHRNNLLMLYKNLPSVYLSVVLLLRLPLELLASLVHLLRGNLSASRAVLKGGWDAWRMHREFRSARQANLEQAVVSNKDILSWRSIFFV